MAEILVFTKDIIGDDVYKNAKLPKRGFVIDVEPDGWPWGKEELSNAKLRILKFPGVDPSLFQSFMMPEMPTQPNINWYDISNTLQMRQYKLDIDHPSLSPTIRSLVADDTRSVQSSVADFDVTKALTLRKLNPPIPDPAVLGTPTNIL